MSRARAEFTDGIDRSCGAAVPGFVAISVEERQLNGTGAILGPAVADVGQMTALEQRCSRDQQGSNPGTSATSRADCAASFLLLRQRQHSHGL